MLSTYRARHNRRCYRKIGTVTGTAHQFITSFAVSSGQACHKQATMPHIMGEAKEVPFALPWLPSVRITSAPSPTLQYPALSDGLPYSLQTRKEPGQPPCRQRPPSTHSGIARRRNLLPRTGARISGTAYQYHALIGYARCLT